MIMKNLSPTEVQHLINTAESPPFLLDVRETWEFEKCQIPNSTLIPMRTVPNNLDQLDKDQEIIVICHHGVRSRVEANFLEQQGFSQMINLSGGVNLWADEVDTSMAKY